MNRAEAAFVGPVNNPGNGHDYYYTTDEIFTWNNAESWAMALGGHLVVIGDASENNWIMGHLPLVTDYYWLGARDDANTSDGVFVWVTGDPWSYTNWAPGEPDDEAGVGGNGNYVALSKSSGTWDDRIGFVPNGGLIAEVLPATGVNPNRFDGDIGLVAQTLASAGKSTIQFYLPRTMSPTLTVFDVGGRTAKMLASGSFDAGSHVLDWDTTDDLGRRVHSGLYFVSLQASGIRKTGRIAVAR